MTGATFRKIHAAVIGGGAFGEAHLRAYRSMPHVEVAGVCTLDRGRAQELAERYGGRIYDDVEMIARDASVDLVSIVTPEDAHAAPFATLARAGKAIYCEKPLATSPGEARAMRDAADAGGLIAMSGHCLRFEARFAHVFAQRDALGPVRHMSFKNRRPQSQKALYGRTHPAYVLLCHEVELANAFAGSPFRRVCALEGRFAGGQVDGMSLLIEYENGATCATEGGWLLPSQSAVDENDVASLDFAGGTFDLQLPHRALTFLAAGGACAINQQYEHTIYGDERGALRSALEYMVDCVARKQRPSISTIDDGYRAVELVDAAIRAARSGRWIGRGEES